MARPTRPILTRQRIGTAAIELVDAGKELQVIPLAERLGVSVSSIYHHARGRDDIIRTMREALIAQTSLVLDDGLGWEDTVRQYASAFRNLFAGHPRVLLLLLTVELSEQEAVAPYRTLITALRNAGLPEDELLTTVEVIDAFIFGVALDVLSPQTIFDPDIQDPEIAELVKAHPHGPERNTRVHDAGVEVLIEGIRARLRA